MNMITLGLQTDEVNDFKITDFMKMMTVHDSKRTKITTLRLQNWWSWWLYFLQSDEDDDFKITVLMKIMMITKLMKMAILRLQIW